MTEPESNWDALDAELGLTDPTPAHHAPPRPAPAPSRPAPPPHREPVRDHVRHAPPEVEEAVAEEDDEADDAEDGEEPGAEPGPAGETPAEAGARKKRRRRRRRKKGGPAVPGDGAAVAAVPDAADEVEATDEAEPLEPAPADAEAFAEHGVEEGEAPDALEGDDELVGEDEPPPSAMDEEMDAETSQPQAEWKITPWVELVATLHRPER